MVGFKLGTADGIKLGLNGSTEIGSSISLNCVILLGLNMACMRDQHQESN